MKRAHVGLEEGRFSLRMMPSYIQHNSQPSSLKRHSTERIKGRFIWTAMLR